MSSVTMMTGSRELEDVDFGTVRRGVIDELVDGRPDEFLFGGALGADSVALEEAGQFLNGKGSDTSLVVVVPWTLNDQPDDAIPIIQEHADDIVELHSNAPVGRASGYHERNEWMVDRADRCRVFWNGESSGTERTAKLAEDAGLDIRVNAMGQLGASAARMTLGQ